MYNFLFHVILIYNFIHYKFLINFLLYIKRYWTTLLYYFIYQKILYCRGGYSPNSVSKLRLNASINIGPVLCFSRHSPGSRPRSDVYPNIQ